MASRIRQASFDRSGSPFRRALQYAFYDWTREMPASKRVITWVGILMQGYANYSLWGRSMLWPFTWPREALLLPSVFVLYVLGGGLMNAMLTSEFVRKTQLESDQIAARRIQQTLQPQLEQLPGYEVETFYKPFRDVGGDYFDMIELSGGRTLFAIADVSGKGMPAALLAANIQALVRSIAQVEADPQVLAARINTHLVRYTPGERFATAVFVVLNRQSGELSYVNAGHNPPIVSSSGSTTRLEATGTPLGLFAETEYEAGAAVIRPGGALLLYTDGVTDSIPGENPEGLLRAALGDGLAGGMSRLTSLVNPNFNEDDVTLLLVKRTAGSGSVSSS